MVFVETEGFLSRIVCGSISMLSTRDWLRNLVQEVCKIKASSP